MAGTRIAISGWEQVEDIEPDPQDSPSGDRCSVCGVALVYGGRGKHPTKCDAHKAKGSTGGGGRNRSLGGATLAEWSRFNVVALTVVTYLVARFASGGQGLFLKCPASMKEQDLVDSTEYLAMTDEEAGPIARLMASKIQPTGFNKKVGKHIVNALEYEDVGIALWTYGKRVGPPLAARMAIKKPAQLRPPKQQSPLRTVQPVAAVENIAPEVGVPGTTLRKVHVHGAERTVAGAAAAVAAVREQQRRDTGNYPSDNGGHAPNT